MALDQLKQLNEELVSKNLYLESQFLEIKQIKKQCRKQEKIIKSHAFELEKAQETIKNLEDKINIKERKSLSFEESSENVPGSYEESRKSYEVSIKLLKEEAEKAESLAKEKENENKNIKNIVKKKEEDLEKAEGEVKSLETSFQLKMASLIKEIAKKDEE